MTTTIFMDYEKPRKLKDFLIDDSHSCSPNVSKTFSRKSWKLTTTKSSKFGMELMQKGKIDPSLVQRSRSKAAWISISAVQRASCLVINAIKFFPFASSIRNSPHQKTINRNIEDHAVLFRSDKVRIKDVLRWKSFNNGVMEKTITPTTFATTVAEQSTTTNSTSCSSSGSSRWDCDFAAEDSSTSWNEDEDHMNEMAIVAKRELPLEENEQHSPVSVLDSAFREDEESLAVSHQGLHARRFQPKQIFTKENVSISEADKETNDFAPKQKVKELLLQLKSRTPESEGSHSLLQDFFMQQISKNESQNDSGFESEILRFAECWVNGEGNGDFHQYWELKGQKEACVRDIEKGVKWNKLDEEIQELVGKLELCVFCDLFDELFVAFT